MLLQPLLQKESRKVNVRKSYFNVILGMFAMDVFSKNGTGSSPENEVGRALASDILFF